MSTSHFHQGILLDRSNSQGSVSSTSIPPYHSYSAAPDMAGAQNRQPISMHTSAQDPFTYYKAYFDTRILAGGSNCNHVDGDDGYTCGSRIVDAHDTGGDFQRTTSRAVPYHVASRFASRSHAAPLATIVEQGSYSTLNSHTSLLSVARFPSIKITENALSGRVSHCASRRSDGQALHDIQEAASNELSLCTVATRQADIHRDYIDREYTPKDLALLQQSKYPDAPMYSAWGNVDDMTSRGALRGAFEIARAVSHTQSQSSSMTYTSALESDDEQSQTSENSLRSKLQASDIPQVSHAQSGASYLVPSSSLGLTPKPRLDAQAVNRKISVADLELSAHLHPPLLKALVPGSHAETKIGSDPSLLPPSVATRSRDKSPSVRLVHPESRDGALDSTTPASTLPAENSKQTSARHTFYGVPDLPRSIVSLAEDGYARDANRNASFCSTQSTSYSGTVLGVDLDLQHESAHPKRRSRSPLTASVSPAWFTPQMAELERQASFRESPESEKTVTTTGALPRTITSSALTSLLPIAAASGIVRRQYDTPQISFYSPSGNLIQLEESTSSDRSDSDFSGTPTMPTSYYTETASTSNNLFTKACIPAVRPALVPMTTPPSSSAPLPPHLRHHHNYMRPEKSQIDSTESFLVHAPPAKGCGGIVKSPSFSPRSGLPHNHMNNKLAARRHRSTRSVIHDMVYEANFYKARLITAATTSRASNRRGTRLRKRHIADSAAAYSYKPLSSPSALGRSHETAQQTSGRKEQGLVGPLAGYTLRICFCQPYDGAGEPTNAISAKRSCIIHSCASAVFEPAKDKALQRGVRKIDSELPIARVVRGQAQEKAGTRRAKTEVGKSNISRGGKDSKTTK